MKTIKNFSSLCEFKTDRLVAKKISHDDFQCLYQMHQNEDVMKTLGGIRSEKMTREYIDWNLQCWEKDGFGLWSFYLKTGEWIGRGGLRRITIDGKEEVEVAYALMPSFWGKGYATEIAVSCIEIAFEILKIDNVMAKTLVSNFSSQKVMKKADLHFERNFLDAGHPSVMYRITQSEYKQLCTVKK